MSTRHDRSVELVSASALERYICEFIARVHGAPATEISPDLDFDRVGLNSADMLRLAGELEERLGVEVPPAMLFEATSIGEAAKRLARLIV